LQLAHGPERAHGSLQLDVRAAQVLGVALGTVPWAAATEPTQLATATYELTNVRYQMCLLKADHTAEQRLDPRRRLPLHVQLGQVLAQISSRHEPEPRVLHFYHITPLVGFGTTHVEKPGLFCMTSQDSILNVYGVNFTCFKFNEMINSSPNTY
jgi:hypothetical protein